jgi:hypothetical protein
VEVYIGGLKAPSHDGRACRAIVDDRDVETARAIGDAAFRQEVVGAARRCRLPGVTLSSGKADISWRTFRVRTSRKASVLPSQPNTSISPFEAWGVKFRVTKT